MGSFFYSFSVSAADTSALPSSVVSGLTLVSYEEAEASVFEESVDAACSVVVLEEAALDLSSCAGAGVASSSLLSVLWSATTSSSTTSPTAMKTGPPWVSELFGASIFLM